MTRLELLRFATQLAHEQVDANSCLSDGAYKGLKRLSEDQAIKRVAQEILKDAASDTE